MNEELRSGAAQELDRLNAFFEIGPRQRAAPASWWSTRSSRSWCGTSAPRTCGACAPTRCTGAGLLGLDIGLPVVMLAEPIRACLAGSQNEELVVRAHNRRGREIECRIFVTPLQRNDHGYDGAVLLMEELG